MNVAFILIQHLLILQTLSLRVIFFSYLFFWSSGQESFRGVPQSSITTLHPSYREIYPSTSQRRYGKTSGTPSVSVRLPPDCREQNHTFLLISHVSTYVFSQTNSPLQHTLAGAARSYSSVFHLLVHACVELEHACFAQWCCVIQETCTRKKKS